MKKLFVMSRVGRHDGKQPMRKHDRLDVLGGNSFTVPARRGPGVDDSQRSTSEKEIEKGPTLSPGLQAVSVDELEGFHKW